MTSASYPISGQPAYTSIAKTLHWVTVILVLFMLPVGYVMARADVGDTLYNLHKSIGPLILMITLFRLYYRLAHPPASLPAELPAIMKFAAHANHGGLYALLIAQPVVGWIATSAYPAPVPFFGLFNLPKIWPDNRALSEQLYALHLWLGITLALLIAMHVGAALFHYFIRKDGILQRMLPR